MAFVLTEHAKEVLAERHIALPWVERVLAEPTTVEQDPEDSAVEHRFGQIEEYGNRVLHVVVDKKSAPIRVITAYFDRKKRNQL